MASSIEDVIKEVQSLFIEVCGTLSEYELLIIENSIRLPMKRVLTSSASMTDMIQQITSNLSELNYFKSKLVQIKYPIQLKYSMEFDKQFTLLTRIGRPSRQAIESEINSTSEITRELGNQLTQINNLLEFLQSQIELLHITIRNYESQKYHN